MSSTARADVLRPLTAIFVMQSVITMAIYALPVIIPVAATDLGIDPESVGFYVAVVYGVSMFAGLLVGDLIRLMGAGRVFCMLVALAGLGTLTLLFCTYSHV